MKNYTITVNGNVYDVTVEEGTSTGAPPSYLIFIVHITKRKMLLSSNVTVYNS